MEKEKLRKKIIASLRQLSPAEKSAKEEQFYKLLFASELWQTAQSIGVTLSRGFEWNTAPIIQRAWKEGKSVSVPKSIHASRALHFYQIDHFDQVGEGYFGLNEPIPEKTKKVDDKKIDLMIVPGVVFTKKGYRIGFGGGYYDRFLKGFTQPTLSIVSECQLSEDIPVEPHDIPVEFLLTEAGISATLSADQHHLSK